jgi:hypothetical protein
MCAAVYDELGMRYDVATPEKARPTTHHVDTSFWFPEQKANLLTEWIIKGVKLEEKKEERKVKGERKQTKN